MRKLFLAVLLSLTLTAPASAEESLISGQAFILHCKALIADDPDRIGGEFRGGMCVGLLVGIKPYSQPKDGVCRPKGTTLLQEARIFVKWLEANPELLHYPASFMVTPILKQAFPCKDKGE